MDERSITLISSSFAKLGSVAEQADALFNARLLDTWPDVYRLFAADIEPEERSLVKTLRLVLGRVGTCGAILPAVRTLAPFHKVCALVDAHYDSIGQTLIWTLRRSLGANFTAEVERAWHDALRAPVR